MTKIKTEEPVLPRGTKGTIIVDSSALIGLWGEVSERLRGQPSKGGAIQVPTYLDTLRCLGRNGFSVVIPEIVSIEAGDVLHTGQSLGNIFGQDRRAFPGQAAALKSFLRQVAQGAEEGIHIVPPSLHSPSHKYVQQMNDAAMPIIERSQRGPSHRKSQRLSGDTLQRKRLMEVQAQSKRNLGDAEIEYMVRHGYASEQSKSPVFVLANDGELLAHINATHAHTLSTRALLYSLADNKLLHAIGVKDEATFAQLDQDAWTGSHPGVEYKYSPIVNEAGYMARLKTFSSMLAGMAEELRSPSAEEKPEGAPPQDRVARFQRRYAGRLPTISPGRS